MVKFGILGPIELRAGDRRLPAGGPRQLALLAFLLLHANRAVSTDQLQDALWSGQQRSGGRPEARADGDRAPAQDARAPGAERPVGPAARSAAATCSRSPRASSTPSAFEDGVARGRALLGRGDAAGAAEALRAALALWRGPAARRRSRSRSSRRPRSARLEELRLGALESARRGRSRARPPRASCSASCSTLSRRAPRARAPRRAAHARALSLRAPERRAGRLPRASARTCRRAGPRARAGAAGAAARDPRAGAVAEPRRRRVARAPQLRTRPRGGQAGGAYAFALPPTLRHAEREAFVGRDDGARAAAGAASSRPCAAPAGS